MVICDNCKKEVDYVCSGGYCKACHISVSWEDCITGTFEAKINMDLAKRAGISDEKAHQFIKKAYPKSFI